jgi:protein arginine N-methyltransferase 1
MTTLELHRTLLSDRLGQEAFRRAIRRAVVPGAVVLDLGTGTGIHALFACEAGARRVYAVDRDVVIELARSIARANRFDDRITFVHADIAEVTLPEPVDVIVAHQSFGDLFVLLSAAKRRFLKPGGRVIPLSAELFAAPAEAPVAFEQMIGFWGERLGFDFTTVREVGTNTVHECRLPPGALLGEGVSLGSFEFATPEPPRLSVDTHMTVVRSGVLHGMLTWSVERLIDDVVLSTAPPSDLPADVWSDSFFPVAEPVSVQAGDVIAFALRTGAGGWGRVWKWTVEVRDAAGLVRRRSSHSSFAGAPLSAATLRKQAPDYVPVLTPHGAALRFVLECLDGRRSTGEIERDVRQRCPDLFASPDDAAVFVARALARYAR